ncbi:MAG: TonB-dependent receptor [Vicinamibacterales bacterium]
MDAPTSPHRADDGGITRRSITTRTSTSTPAIRSVRTSARTSSSTWATSRFSCRSNGIQPYSLNAPGASVHRLREAHAQHRVGLHRNHVEQGLGLVGELRLRELHAEAVREQPRHDVLQRAGGYTRERLSASFGLDDYSYNSNPSSWSMKDTGVYRTGKLRLAADRVIVSGGVRVDAYNNQSTVLADAKDNHVGGSVGVAFLPDAGIKLRANYAEGFKVPSPQQVAGDGAVYYLPNLALEPENSKTFEFGADVDRNHVNAAVTWFHAGLEQQDHRSWRYWCVLGRLWVLPVSEHQGVDACRT